MDKYIEIYDKDGKTKKAEVIFRFKDEENNNHYIVYKHNRDYFAAKYDDIIGKSSLNTDLNAKELEILEKLLNEMTEL